MSLINVELLIKLRKQKKLSQSELARRVGVTRFMINGMEAGRKNPGLGLAIRMANILDCKVDDLIFFNHNEYSRETKRGDEVNG